MRLLHNRLFGKTDFQPGNGPAISMGGYIFLVFLLHCSCTRIETGSQNALERNLQFSGKNRPEMEKVLARYSQDPGDSLKLRAAIFLISNMEDSKHLAGDWFEQFDPIFTRTAGLGNDEIKKMKDSVENIIGRSDEAKVETRYDLQHINSGYLIGNIDEAFDAWQNAPWKNEVDFDSFCNYVLPYKSFSEHFEEWRSFLRNKYRYILDDPNIPDAMEDISCALVDDEVRWFGYSEDFSDYPAALSIFQILEGKKGNCVEMANLAAYSARALGIPVAIDFTPLWANFSGAHMWNALILPEGEFWPFIGVEGYPGDYRSISEGESKIAKAYRRKAAYDSSSFAAKIIKAGIREIPEILSNPRISDVTSAYTQVKDVFLKFNSREGTPVYLCLFDRGSWKAVSGTIIHNQTALFPDMGQEVLYMPMFYKNHQYKIAGPPILVKGSVPVQELRINSHKNQSLKLFRKYPLKRARINDYMQTPLYHSRLEGSQSPDFKDPVLLHEILPIPGRYRPRYQRDLTIKDRTRYDSLWMQAILPDTDSFRFVRFLFPQGQPVRLGELEVYHREDGKPLQGIPMGNVPDPASAFDGIPGRSIKPDSIKIDSAWVGLDLGKRVSVRKIRYLPADDQNSIEPGKKYELFYWQDHWISAGTQVASGVFLEYNGIPSGTVYWLRCRNCGNREERPFTYEEGSQVWW